MMNRMRIHAQVSQEYRNRAIITRGLYILNTLFEGQMNVHSQLSYIQEISTFGWASKICVCFKQRRHKCHGCLQSRELSQVRL